MSFPYRQTPRLNSSARFLKAITVEKGINVGCILCEIAWGGLLDWLRNGDLAQLISFILPSVVCNILPSEYTGCADFLGVYIGPVYQMTIDEVRAKFKPCTLLKLCDPTDLKMIQQLSKSEKNSVMCEGCTLMTQFIQHELSDVSLQDDLSHLVERALCSMFDSATEKQQCKAMIETYLPAVFQELAIVMNPQKVCPKLRMCPGPAIEFRKVPKKTHPIF